MKKLSTIFLYILIPFLTISTEDTFYLKRLASRENDFLFNSDVFGVPPMLAVFFLAIILILLLKVHQLNIILAKGNILLMIALLSGSIVGLYGHTDFPAPLFEFRYWRSLVFFSVLTILIIKTFNSINRYNRYVEWFVFVQSIYAIYVLTLFFGFGTGQMSNTGHLTPIFAGDQLAFMILAGFVLSARNINKWSVISIFQQMVILIVLILSLRRTSLAAAIISVALPIFTALINSKSWQFKRIISKVVVGLIAVSFISGILLLVGTDLTFLEGRIRSINPFWASQQTKAVLSSMGHNEDLLDGWDLVKEAPWGKGLNNDFVPSRTGSWQTNNLHSTMFSIWVKLGIPGLLFYLFVVTYGIRFLFKGSLLLDPQLSWITYFVISFSAFNFISTVYANGIFFGYKATVCLALYMSGCVILSKFLQQPTYITESTSVKPPLVHPPCITV